KMSDAWHNPELWLLLATVLGSMHNKGIVHLDLDETNILLSRTPHNREETIHKPFLGRLFTKDKTLYPYIIDFDATYHVQVEAAKQAKAQGFNPPGIRGKESTAAREQRHSPPIYEKLTPAT